ncbi:hypothetical protein [Mobiluncus mulieris]|uniref:Uncharacterized protein n=1 Tax=Mobiluncus mulieris TaxID=2052 RepID=A0ABD4TYJ5_9ACTO|nr:hypothetical protein [Mobiluncus mulieris]EEZ90343.1 hypothetical protein HMPREF0578_0249 [Mobiluncus mulieris 28-1]MCU9969445.1 hypothetical protein [Mobiluncus mulieris]MCU9970135.1 hypothetical protein [Mobiluncus mulieris]MCV0009230.1 hypothetical protein [Mobiluncus mulieris]NMW89889.1 hypothetical protein [Mobiluncus mulieris]
MTCLNFRMNLERQVIMTENGRASRKAIARIRRDLRARTVMKETAPNLVTWVDVIVEDLDEQEAA